MSKAKLQTYCVVLKDGSDINVRARSKSDAIKRAKAGKGRKVGLYLNPRSRDRAYLPDSESTRAHR